MRNFTIRNVAGSNTSGAAGGGIIWVRNITGDGADIVNATQDILIECADLATGTADEALAIYGCNGLVQRVTVRKTRLRSLIGEGTRKHGTLVSVFPRALDSQPMTAGVKDVLFDDCDFDDGNFNDHVFRTGRTNDEALLCENICVQNSRFNVTQAEDRLSHLARNIAGAGGNVRMLNCTVRTSIDGVVTDYPITFGVLNFDVVEGCDIDGTFQYPAHGCKEVRDNKRIRNSLSVAVKNCGRVLRNVEISATDTAVVCEATGFYEVRNNGLATTKTDGPANYAVLFNSTGGSAPAGDVAQNRIRTAYGLSYPVAATAGVGRIRVYQNSSTGTGQSSLLGAAHVAEQWGNDLFGVLDANRVVYNTTDADLTITAGYPDILVNCYAPITADRTITLPPVASCRNGYRARVYRHALATGNFDFIVASSPAMKLRKGETAIDFEIVNGQWKPIKDGVLSLTVGDADMTLPDHPDIHISLTAAITAARMITLPVNAENGWRVRAYRHDLGSGAYDWTIGSATPKALSTIDTHADFIRVLGQWKFVGAAA
ncbi:hypothetical protein [Sphingobium yanoikuyae]|uniref:hypothetical protein n=1 Tax=Sphingobium yanoikuyae TaxID=13690 RepID=UPI000496702F|nr:hypothetical protein [Sphingobium yanoikuyae]